MMFAIHSYSHIAQLIRQIEHVAQRHAAERVTGVTIELGALNRLTPEHLRNHFVQAARDTVAHGARLTIRQRHDIYDPYAEQIVLAKVDLLQ